MPNPEKLEDLGLVHSAWQPTVVGTVICDQCGERHEAEYSHESYLGQGSIYAVVCTADGMTDYYTVEHVQFDH